MQWCGVGEYEAAMFGGETGLAAEIIDKVGGINNEFVCHANDTRYDKTVSFYLTAAVGGNMANHDAGYGMVS